MRRPFVGPINVRYPSITSLKLRDQVYNYYIHTSEFVIPFQRKINQLGSLQQLINATIGKYTSRGGWDGLIGTLQGCVAPLSGMLRHSSPVANSSKVKILGPFVLDMCTWKL